MGSLHHTPQTRARVIEEFAKCGRIDVACERAGVDRGSHYNWLKSDPEYATAFESARDQSIDLLESEGYRRAFEGTLKPVYQGGEKVGEIREYSDSLLTWILRGRRREVYGDKTELSGPSGAPLVVNVSIVPPKNG